MTEQQNDEPSSALTLYPSKPNSSFARIVWLAGFVKLSQTDQLPSDFFFLSYLRREL